MENRDFDSMIARDLEGLPIPQQEMEEITPWKQATGRIVWGGGLTSFTLQFLYLDYLLPAIGTILLWLGFRTLRQENRHFRLCYVISLLRLGGELIALSVLATTWGAEGGMQGWVLLLGLFPLLQYICLWKAIKSVRQKAGQPPETSEAKALVVWYSVVGVLALMGAQGLLFGLPMLIAYVLIIKNLSKIPELLDGVGYQVQAAPVRLSDRTAWAGWIAAVLACIVLCGALFGRYPMAWAPVADGEHAGLERVEDRLEMLGMPLDVLADLSAADLYALADAISVAVEVSEHPFNDGRMEEQIHENDAGYKYVWQSTVYDVYELKIQSIAIQLPNERWKVIHHFQWQEEPAVRGTECIQLFPVDRWGQAGFVLEGALSGRVLYDHGGTTYTSSYHSLARESYITNSLLIGNQMNDNPVAKFSLPRQGENCRGYVAYEMRQVYPGYYLDSWMTYARQTGRSNYPLKTAWQYVTTAMFWDGPFMQAQTAIQVDTTGEGE